jgi:uncharacterized phage protein (TIGR02216 family)
MLPWEDMLRAALAAGLPSEAFWRLSLREWRWIAAASGGPEQQKFEVLMARFPDKGKAGL